MAPFRLAVILLALGAANGCVAVSQFAERFRSSCDGASVNAIGALVRGSPLVVDYLNTAVRADGDSLEMALRRNAIPISYSNNAVEVSVSCQPINDSMTAMTLFVKNEWRVSGVMAGGGMPVTLAAVNITGGPPVVGDPSLIPSIVANRSVQDRWHASASYPRPATEPPVLSIRQPVVDLRRPAATTPPVELAVVRPRPEPRAPVPPVQPTATQSPVNPPSTTVHKIIVEPSEGRAEVDPVCAVIRPPNLREAVKAALLCAGSDWTLIPPTETEPTDYTLPHAIRLSGGPNDWVVVLSDTYGLRFERTAK